MICNCCFKPKDKEPGYRSKMTKEMWAKVNLYMIQKDLVSLYGSWFFCNDCLRAVVTDDTEYLNTAELKRKLLA